MISPAGVFDTAGSVWMERYSCLSQLPVWDWVKSCSGMAGCDSVESQSTLSAIGSYYVGDRNIVYVELGLVFLSAQIQADSHSHPDYRPKLDPITHSQSLFFGESPLEVLGRLSTQLFPC